MLSKVLKITGGIVAGIGAVQFVKVLADTSYAMGFQAGELTQMNILSELEELCEGLSLEYVSHYTCWKEGNVKNRIRASDVLYDEPFKVPFVIKTKAMNTVRNKDAEYAKKLDVKNNKVIGQIHQYLLANWANYASRDEDADIYELRLYKLDDLKLDNEILTNLAIKYNIAYVERDHEMTFVGCYDNVHKFGDNFWTNYNLMAMDLDKPGISVGRYDPTSIESDE